MAELQELFTKVTGLTWDIEAVKDEKTAEELAWLIPDGAMLDDPEYQKAKDTKELLGLLGLSEDTKFSEVDIEEGSDDSSDDSSSDYDDEENTNNDSSDND